MNKLTLLTIGLSFLAGCNSSDKSQPVTPKVVASTPADSVVLRNMAVDVGNSIVATDAVDVPDGEGVGNLIDGDHASKFLSFAPSASVVFSATLPYVIKGYELVSADDQPKRDPLLWTLEGSVNGTDWVEMDSQNGQTFAARSVTNNYPLSANESAYQYYRFNFTHAGTDDFGADILQLGELALLVKADKPLVAFKTDKARAEKGEEVIFLDQSLANPTAWQWTFDGGTPATSTEQHPTVTFDSIGAKTVTLVASNDKGSNTLAKEQTIWIWDPTTPWAGFPQPEVTLNKLDPEHPGQQAMDRVLPNLTDDIHAVSLAVAKVLYQNVTQIKLFKTVLFETGHYDFPAAKSGTEQDMILLMDLDHLANVAADGDAALRSEVLGMLWHELTHGYSSSPLTGQYETGDEYHTFLESVADFVRIRGGFNEHKRSGVKWVTDWNVDAYNQTSFFLEWVQNNEQVNFIQQFNQLAATLTPWSFDAAFKAILGEDRGIEVLWDQYQQTYLLGVLGLSPPYPTPLEGFSNFAVAEGVEITTNATDIGIWGEGVNQLIDNNVNLKFNAVIEEPWWIPVHAAELQPINSVENVQLTITVPEAKVLDKYSLSTANDNSQRDPTAWTVSGSTDGENWVWLADDNYPPQPTRLTTYHFNVADNQQAYAFYQFVFENTQQGEGVGGDNGRLVQIGELALLTGE